MTPGGHLDGAHRMIGAEYLRWPAVQAHPPAGIIIVAQDKPAIAFIFSLDDDPVPPVFDDLRLADAEPLPRTRDAPHERRGFHIELGLTEAFEILRAVAL